MGDRLDGAIAEEVVGIDQDGDERSVDDGYGRLFHHLACYVLRSKRAVGKTLYYDSRRLRTYVTRRTTNQWG